MRRLAIVLLALSIAACTGQTPTRSNARLLKKPSAGQAAKPGPTTAPATASPEATPTPADEVEATPTPSPTPTPAAGSLGLISGAPLSGTWLPGPALHRPRAGLAAGVIGGSLYAFEGESRPSLEVLEGDAWALDASYDLTLPSYPEIAARGGRSLVLGVTGNTGVILAGGHTGTGRTGELLFYTENGLEGAAGELAAPVVAAAGGKLGGQVAIAGGLDATGKVSALLRLWSVAGESESAGAAMPLGVAGAAGAVLDGKLYVLGGYTLDGDGQPVAQAAVQIYDPTTDTWRWSGDGQAGAPAALPAARHSAAAAVLGGQLYLLGGAGTDGAALAGGLRYGTAANSWTAIAPMPTPRALHALVAHEGALWAIGGFGSDRLPLASVEVYHP